MRSIQLAAAAAAALAALAPAAPARGYESILDRPMEKEGWPSEITRRPLGLARGMFEVTAPVNVELSDGRVGQPVFLSPSLYYGVTDTLTVGLRHVVGLCVTGSDNGCRKAYNDLALDSIWRLYRGTGVDLALGAALVASPISDPFALAGEVRVVGRVGGPIALAVAPTFQFGITQRDAALVKDTPDAFPLASYGFGWVNAWPENKEILTIPASLTFQLTPAVAFSVAGALAGPVNPTVGSFGDSYRIPIGAAVVVSPSNRLDVGVSFTFENLAGKQVAGTDRVDLRGGQGWVALRL